MSIHSIETESTTFEGNPARRKNRLAAGFAAAVALGAGATYLLISKGIELRAAANLQRATEIANENRAICDKWGMRQAVVDFATCAKDLDDVRARHEQRINADIHGLIGG